jgi:5-methylcytosine-specific restriction endonuclease McrA
MKTTIREKPKIGDNGKTVYDKKAWKLLNKDRTKEMDALWYQDNKERVRAMAIVWNKENPEKAKVYAKTYRDKNPHKGIIYAQIRRTRKKGNGGSLSDGIIDKLLLFQRGRCCICRCKLSKSGYNLDHIMPISKGGQNADSNVQLTCPKCNAQKRAKDPIKFMQERGYLL